MKKTSLSSSYHSKKLFSLEEKIQKINTLDYEELLEIANFDEMGSFFSTPELAELFISKMRSYREEKFFITTRFKNS